MAGQQQHAHFPVTSNSRAPKKRVQRIAAIRHLRLMSWQQDPSSPFGPRAI
jgi:hypothetical protein